MSKNQKTSLIKVIFLSASGFFLFVCMDSTAKYLGNVMPVTQAVWGRFFFHFVALCVYFVVFKPKLNLTRNFNIQIIRSLLMVTATFFMFNSLQRFDLVDIYVVFFSAPLIVSLLSAYFKRYTVSLRHNFNVAKFWINYLCSRTKYESAIARINLSYSATIMLGTLSIFYKTYFWQ